MLTIICTIIATLVTVYAVRAKRPIIIRITRSKVYRNGTNHMVTSVKIGYPVIAWLITICTL